MLKGVKIRLYLNKEQEQKLNSLLGSYRFVYNQALFFKINKYQTEKKSTNIKDTSKLFHGTFRNEYEFLKEHNTKVIKQSLRDLEVAYSNFFKQKKGFPKFKSKHSEQRCGFPSEAISVDTFKGDKLNLTKSIKDLKFKCSDRDKKYLTKNKEGIKSVTIIKTKTGKFFASILVDGNINKIINKPINNSIGIDLGIKTLLTLSNSTTFDNLHFIKRNEKRLKKLHKQLSKKVKGSNNRNKTRLRLAKKHEEIRNQKINYLHNITSKIVNENQVIIMEDLNVSGMLNNRKLAKAIQELSLFELRRQLEYKSKWYKRDLIFVDRFYPSSKLCSCCRWKNVNLKLSDREFICEECGVVLDRDLNASINIKNEGLRIYNQLKLAG